MQGGLDSMVTGEIGDGIILVARVFLATLFLIFGCRKLADFSGTVSQMVQDKVPTPRLAAGIALFIELPVGFAVAIGAFTRPSALVFFFYTLGTSLIEHRYWTKARGQRLETLENFYKNLSIMGGFALLFVTGAGRYSIDSLIDIGAR